MSRFRHTLTSLALSPVAFLACGGTIDGTVTDYHTGAPIGGAEVTSVEHGWGFSDGSLVWDKDKSSAVTTAPDGTFTARFRNGASAKLRVRSRGYQAFESVYARGADVGIRLKRRVEDAPVLPSGFLQLGLMDDGTTYGWNFARGEIARSPEDADILPVTVGEGARDAITFRALGEGGIRFVPARELGVDDLFLVYTDEAPADGYQDTAMIDFTSEGGVYFVRTRDGGHYAKFAFTPTAFGQIHDPGSVRDLALHFVYNPDGSRNLLYQVRE